MSSDDQDGQRTFLRPTEHQVIALIEFLEKNPSLIKNDKTPMTQKKNQLLWKQITKHLNSMGGARKNFKQWNRYWIEKKSNIKKKLTRATTEEPFKPSEAEKRIAALCRSYFSEADAALVWGSQTNSSKNISIDIKIENVQQECDESPPPSPPSPVSEDDFCEDQMPSIKEERLSPCPSTSSHRGSVGNSRAARDIRRGGSAVSRRLRSLSSSYKKEQRRLKQELLKVKQHQLEVKKKLVKVQQQQTQVQEQVQEKISRMMQTLLEQSSERECTMKEVLNTVGDGMCAIGEGLKNLADIARTLVSSKNGVFM